MIHSILDIGHRPVKSRAGYLSVGLMLALVCAGAIPQAAFSADKDKGSSDKGGAAEKAATIKKGDAKGKSDSKGSGDSKSKKSG